ncbi:hypothetical protein NFI00_000229 [Salmonella enterica]|nr:hypothetical protein [Salmonella enterica subsp. enterica serovar Minnesota]EJI5696526.1 hypothetical protein [Salmonella enterica]
MSKSIKIAESQLGFVGETKEFVVTGVKADSFTIAKDEQVLSVEGKLDGLKVADLVVVKDGALWKKGTETSQKKHNPSPATMAEYGF